MASAEKFENKFDLGNLKLSNLKILGLKTLFIGLLAKLKFNRILFFLFYIKNKVPQFTIQVQHLSD